MSMQDHVRDLAMMQARLQPLRDWLTGAPPSAPGLEAKKKECERLEPREMSIISVIARTEPATPADALALALVLFDYCEDPESGGPDLTGNQHAAARGLLAYLSRAAGVEPRSLGIFTEALDAYDRSLPLGGVSCSEASPQAGAATH